MKILDSMKSQLCGIVEIPKLTQDEFDVVANYHRSFPLDIISANEYAEVQECE